MITSIQKSVPAVLITSFLFFVLAVSAQAASVFSDGFESATFSKWTKVDTGTLGKWKIDTSRYTGRYSAHVTGNTGATDDVLSKALSTEIYADPALSFMFKASSLDSKTGTGEFDRFFAEYSTDGQKWTIVKEINGLSVSEMDGSWRKVRVSVPSHKNFQFRFRAHLSDTGDRVWIDDVLLEGTVLENAQSACSDRIDNDEDGLIDSRDPDCDAFYSDLTVTKFGSGGSVFSSPAGISCGTDCTEQYFSSTVVSLHYALARGFSFSGWGGDCSGSGSCFVSMSSDKTVTAAFSPLTSYTLSVSNEPVSGGVINGLGINCGSVCNTKVYAGEVITLEATPNAGFIFTGWSGRCADSGASCTLPIDADISSTAHYEALAPGICGNGIVEWNETCDDGNALDGDSCPATCRFLVLVCNGTPTYPICTFQ